jgi:hypothetical protein
MTESTVQIDSTDYRLFVTRESNQYRVFWFCPKNDCYGAYRSDHLCATKAEALRVGREAAHRHHEQAHQPAWSFANELRESSGPMRIFG